MAVLSVAAVGSRQFLTLGIDSDLFAVDVAMVNEILDMRSLAHIPNAPDFVAGMIDVRGQSVPVLDLRLKLGLPPAGGEGRPRIVVLETEIAAKRLLLGLMADHVYEVTPLDDNLVEPPPEIGVRWRSEYIAGVGRRQGSFVIVLDLRRLLASDEVALLPQT